MKKVLITGASSGLGKAIAYRLSMEGEGGFSMNGAAIPSYVTTDFSRHSGVDLILPGIPEFDCDILICNAGCWDNNWRLNIEAPIEMIERMPKEKLSIIILSNAAYQDYGNSAYSAAKSGLLLFARRKQREGFNIITISPGTIDGTNFWDNAEIDNRKKGSMPVRGVAELVYQAIKVWECGCLITELIVLPRKDK